MFPRIATVKGKRWTPDWLPAHQITKQQRVKVKHEQLNQWYRTLDALLSVKEQIEEGLYLRVRDLFSVKVDLVFYDLTSMYFCRKSPVGKLRRHGHSKEAKPRQVQVVPELSGSEAIAATRSIGLAALDLMAKELVRCPAVVAMPDA